MSYRELLSNLTTREELSYLIYCDHNKYGLYIPGLKVFEGSEHLIKVFEYCRNVHVLLKCLNYMNIKAHNSSTIYLCMDSGVRIHA